LALVEVQAVEGGDCPLGERTDPLAQAVVLGERIPLLGKGLVLLGDAASPAIEFLGPALQLHELDQPGLVEVDQPAALGLGGLGPALQAGELGGEQLVVGCRRSGGDRAFAGQQHLGTQQRLAHLVKDEAIQRVGANVALGAAVLLTPGPQRVVVAAVVVAMAGPVAAAHLVAVDTNATGAALQQPTQQPLARLGPAWAPLGVVPAHPPGGLEEVIGDDRRHGDLDPFLPRPRHLPRAAPGTGIGH
jgi:hypothetical protein